MKEDEEMQDCKENPNSLDHLSLYSETDTTGKVKWNDWFCQVSHFKNIIRHSSDGYAIISLEGKYISVNPGLSRILGYTEKEFQDLNYQSLTHPNDLGSDLDSVQALMAGDGSSLRREKRYKHKNGQYVWIQLDLTLIRDEEGFPQYFAAQLQEISERKRSEKALKESEEKFRQLSETIDEAFWMKDAETQKLLYVSPAYERIWGRSMDSLFENPDSWLNSVHPDDLHLALQTIPKKKEDGNKNEKFRIRLDDGAERWIRLRTFPVFGADGSFERILGVARDVTQQHELERQLAHSQRMESIGSLAGGVAHDFNNILTVILGFSSLLERNRENPEKILQSVEVIRKTAERGTSLVRQLLTLARKVESFFRPIALNDLISEALNIAKSTFPKSISIDSDIPLGLIKINADYTQIHQIFLNLILNAKDAMPTGGNISVSLRTAEDPLSEKGSKMALLEVKDNGTGMDEETKRKIFDPFFTTKEPGKGTGLGLALVYSILENHKGRITVESSLGQGTKFTVYLPVLSESKKEDPFFETSPKDEKKDTRTVLLIEDEEMIRIPLAGYLSEFGHKLYVAQDGEEGIAAYSQHKEDIDVVICDLNLPKANGLEVLRKIRAQDRNLPLFLASGYIDPKIKADLEEIGIKCIIQKPYHFESILKKIQNI
ncbi:PAS domain S-box protein [Leptospira langatensis]|uniref:histidine kinase n=2 Tax=Leptospira langatensis TaxID=2484983 RepID=A0A5F1ZZE9_9LEPT|nr:PAS domain S-box protein [Leptospira langatensis]TGL43359.1 PAS domain S-box protein [Leptospira langatensis]